MGMDVTERLNKLINDHDVGIVIEARHESNQKSLCSDRIVMGHVGVHGLF